MGCQQQVQMFTTIEITGLVLISLIGFLVLRRVWLNGRGGPAEEAYSVIGHDHVHETSERRPGYS